MHCKFPQQRTGYLLVSTVISAIGCLFPIVPILSPTSSIVERTVIVAQRSFILAATVHPSLPPIPSTPSTQLGRPPLPSSPHVASTPTPTPVLHHSMSNPSPGLNFTRPPNLLIASSGQSIKRIYTYVYKVYTYVHKVYVYVKYEQCLYTYIYI